MSILVASGPPSASSMVPLFAEFEELGCALLIRGGFDATTDELSENGNGLGWRRPPPTAVIAIREVTAALGMELMKFPAYGAGAAFHRIGVSIRTGQLLSLAQRPLSPHTDLPHCRFASEPEDDREPMPDVVILACVSSDGETETSSQRLESALAKLSFSQQALLTERRFCARTPTAWQGEHIAHGVPCILSCHDRYVVRLSPNLMWSPSPPHQAAIEALIAAAAKGASRTVLRAGDLLILHNTRLIHGRGVPRREGTTRLIARAYARKP